MRNLFVSLTAAACMALSALIMVALPVQAATDRPVITQKAAQSAAAASGVASGATATISVTVPGAALGDACIASHSVDVTGIILGCAVTSANTAKVTATNHTTNGVALSSGTTRVFLIKKGTQ
jgi:hypothetical protein